LVDDGSRAPFDSQSESMLLAANPAMTSAKSAGSNSSARRSNSTWSAAPMLQAAVNIFKACGGATKLVAPDLSMIVKRIVDMIHSRSATSLAAEIGVEEHGAAPRAYCTIHVVAARSSSASRAGGSKNRWPIPTFALNRIHRAVGSKTKSSRF
jgi:hypothetical protein